MTDPQWWQAALAALAVLAGAVAVHTTGMGFALLSSPFLVMALGPVEGILVTNVCGIAAALLNLAVVRRDLDWARAARVVPAGLVGTIPGALLVLWLPAPVLAIAISLLVLAGLLFTMGARRLDVPNSLWVGAGGGFASGLMNVTAGVGGPGLVVYALATRWEHRSFAATAQLHFAVLGIAALVAKWSLPSLPAAGWAVLLALLVVGLAGGTVLARRVDGPRAMRWVVMIALVGALLSLGQGLLRL
ncbi:sulfite exporter TauE/SafE family protein [Brachybacterium saurashtrense]|uniref:Probable membrane transporter protein n=1 Tax=Brachybacterium saurashtrense TaxID=556288 RepID=A0A345YS34_9MICO|nr:sulfite exporter TauE/SafE family protein [Brachybacterium saurashtrense]AXK46736.1 sulfite exporter TauE/SafE family protein [Brachybacterium saurashtrense]RRR22451.1 sulfite exporter TauE/SafE family protein [Brachybacterium saurashtrense]